MTSQRGGTCSRCGASTPLPDDLRTPTFACGRCGGVNAVRDDGSVQLTCSFCGVAVLLSDHVDAGAVARHRLKHGVFAMRDEALRANAAHTRKVNTAVAVVVALLFVGVVVANLVVTRR